MLKTLGSFVWMLESVCGVPTQSGQQWTKEDQKSHFRLAVSRASLFCLCWLLVFQLIPKSVLKMV
jgi:hypothetical protein